MCLARQSQVGCAGEGGPHHALCLWRQERRVMEVDPLQRCELGRRHETQQEGAGLVGRRRGDEHVEGAALC
eukprot:2520641-Lingulodinium_polyedra.AAC.1